MFLDSITMDRCFVKFGLILSAVIFLAGADTRFECIAGIGGNGYGFGGDSFGGFGDDRFGGDMGEGFGEADEFEGFGETESDGMPGMMGIQAAVGSLNCPKGNRGSIMVKRVTYGVGAFPGTCQPTPFCGVHNDVGESVANKCDGKSTCSVNILQPKMMSCGQFSNYMHVEYECVDTWATFEICESITTVAKSASVLITSPGYLGTSNLKNSRTQMCECIIQSHDKADLYMDYLQTQLASEDNSCPYEFVLIESKKNLTQAKNDRELEVCGNRHIAGQWFEGSLRVTYASGGSLEKRGLLVKFTVDNIGNTPMIELECGKVDSKNLNLQQRPPSKPKKPSSNSFFPSGMPAMPGLPLGMPTFPTMPSFSGVGPNMNAANVFSNVFGSRPTSNKKPDFSHWKINVAGERGNGKSSSSASDTVKVRLPTSILKGPTGKSAAAAKPNSPAKLVPSIQRPDRERKPTNRKPTRNNRGKKPGARIAVGDEDGTTEETVTEQATKSGGSTAFVISAIGAVLILGSVGILAIHNYRKRQRIRKEEAAYMSGGTLSVTYGKGWKGNDVTEDEESVYATVAEVDMYRSSCVNPAVTPDIEISQPQTSDVAVECKLYGDHGNTSNQVENTSPKTHGRSDVRKIEERSRKLELLKSMTSKYQQTTSQPKHITKHVTVIDVHKSYDDEEEDSVTSSEPASATSPDLHTTACLDGCMYAPVTPPMSRCRQCNISRPARRRDREGRGYDNNLSVKYKCPKD